MKPKLNKWAIAKCHLQTETNYKKTG